MLTVSRILHAGYPFECSGAKIAIDPIFESTFSVNCSAFPEVRFDRERISALRLDAVFITHHHDDHCSLESLALLDRSTPIYLYCADESLLDLIRSLGFHHVVRLAIDRSVFVGPFELIPRRALDEDVDSMFEIRAEGLRVLDVADAWIHPEALPELTRAPWDLVLWPFQTMRELEVLSPSRHSAASTELPEEWIAWLRALSPRAIVPSSCQLRFEPWSWLNAAYFPISYASFEAQLAAALPASRIIRLDPSRSLGLTRAEILGAPPIDLVAMIGAAGDYRYDPSAPPQSTAEIARHLGGAPGDHDRAVAYARGPLLDRLRSLEAAEGYFADPRIWRLALLGPDGAVETVHYRVSADEIAIVAATAPAWSTEIPSVKLMAALERGEQLNAIYVRINDQRFTDAVEADLAGADVLEDPLLRALYEGIFGAYPRAQLERLRRT